MAQKNKVYCSHRRMALDLVCEAIGTAFLVMAIVGSTLVLSGIDGDAGAVALKAGVPAIMLAVMISVFGPISGGHFNPAVSFAFMITGAIDDRRLMFYITAQVIGGLLGAALAQTMFGEVLWALPVMGGAVNLGIILSEMIGAFGLVLVVLFCVYGNLKHTAFAVGGYLLAVGAATSSGAFVNPAVTFARIFSPTAAGIDPLIAVLFIAGQVVAAVVAAMLYHQFRTVIPKQE